MYKNYTIPLQLFLILEKCDVNLFLSKKTNSNNINIFLPQNFSTTVTLILINELFLSNSSIIENSGIDAFFLKKLNNYKFNNWTNTLYVYYNAYFYFLKLRITLFFPLLKQIKINSLDAFYKNNNWLERETSEMYNIRFSDKKDARKLLLDYSSNFSPLIKKFPLEGNTSYFFNFFENQVTTQTTEL